MIRHTRGLNVSAAAAGHGSIGSVSTAGGRDVYALRSASRATWTCFSIHG